MSIPRPTKRGGKYPQPLMPPRTLVRQNGVTIENYYCSQGDHGPPHLHLHGKGDETRIGQNGHPLKNDPAPSPAQKEVISDNRALIRKALKKIGRWYYYEKRLDSQPD